MVTETERAPGGGQAARIRITPEPALAGQDPAMISTAEQQRLIGAISAIVSDSLAKMYFPGESPLGQHVKFGGSERPTNPWLRIVGVVGGLAELVVIGVTLRSSIPAHNSLQRGFDEAAHARLLATNWIRTAFWTLRGIVAIVWLVT